MVIVKLKTPAGKVIYVNTHYVVSIRQRPQLRDGAAPHTSIVLHDGAMFDVQGDAEDIANTIHAASS